MSLHPQSLGHTHTHTLSATDHASADTHLWVDHKQKECVHLGRESQISGRGEGFIRADFLREEFLILLASGIH